MIPKSVNTPINTIELANEPTKTYLLDIENNRIVGFTDGLEAIKQAIYLMLNTERYEYIIYSWNYGLATIDLYGKDMNYVISEVQRRVTEALLTDGRITSVSDFNFERNRNKLQVVFTAHTIYGNVDSSVEVIINGV